MHRFGVDFSELQRVLDLRARSEPRVNEVVMWETEKRKGLRWYGDLPTEANDRCPTQGGWSW